MKLAEALREKKLLKGELNRLRSRAIRASVYTVTFNDEGFEHRDETYTEEEFDNFKKEVEEKSKELVELQQKIVKANVKEVDNTCVQDLLIERSALTEKLAFVQQLSMGTVGYCYDEDIQKKHRITAKETDDLVDELIKKQAEIDAKINYLNAVIDI